MLLKKQSKDKLNRKPNDDTEIRNIRIKKNKVSPLLISQFDQKKGLHFDFALRALQTPKWARESILQGRWTYIVPKLSNSEMTYQPTFLPKAVDFTDDQAFGLAQLQLDYRCILHSTPEIKQKAAATGPLFCLF